jgi:hypothetical protein
MLVFMTSSSRSASRSTAGPLAFGGLLAAVLTGAPPTAAASCPTPEEIQARLVEVDLERGTRTTRFSTPPPRKKIREAVEQVGKLFTHRDGKKGFGVVVIELPVGPLWAAVNDEDAHDIEGYLPLNRSEIIGGTPRGTSRRVFQAGERMGLGRWWVTRTVMNGDLFMASEGALWEVVWEDDMKNVDRKRPPVDDPPDLSPIKWSRGTWLLVPLGESCTFLEHFTWSDPGGFVGFIQGLVLGKALRQSIEGILRLAEERYRALPDGPPFVRPDGAPLGARPGAEPTDGDQSER